MSRLPVMETFLSVQGEGFHQGRLAYFIRLAGCDVGCSWCDVKESWPVSEDQYKSIDSLVTDAQKTSAKIIIITGGEPLMYNLEELTNALHKSGFQIHLETSGAYELTGKFDWVCLSPKKFKKALNNIYPIADELKMVVVNKHDLQWAEEESAKVSSKCTLYLQAEWDKRDSQYQAIYSYIAEHPKWRTSIQTHKYLGLP